LLHLLPTPLGLSPESALAMAGAIACEGGCNLVSWAAPAATQIRHTSSFEEIPFRESTP